MIAQSLFILYLLTISVIDIKTKRIPDVLTYSGIILLFFYKFMMNNQSVLNSLFLIITGFIPFFLIWYFTKGKLGLGDAKFSAFLSLALGSRDWFLMLFLSSFIALIFALYMIKIRKVNSNVQIPYGPFLSTGAVLTFCIQ